MDALVASRLSRATGEYTLPSLAPGSLRPVESFEAYALRASDQVRASGAAALAALQTPPDPQLLRIKSWQYGLTDATSDTEVSRAAQDALFLRLQAYRDDYLTSETWTRCLACFERPERWLGLGRELEGEGQLVAANAAFAAALWLEPAEVAEAVAGITQARSPRLPARLREQPRPGFRALPFRERHWQAWDMKNSSHLDLPSLLAYESDINFSVRTRIYRSLGQRPHPAAIEALHEATGDPHPFARAQALRSLGRIGDPTAVALLRRHLDDSDAEVRRAAVKAIQRVVGYWLHFGEWWEIVRSPAQHLAVIRELASRGLPSFAFESLALYPDDPDADPEVIRLEEELEAVSLPRDYEDRRTEYHDWFKEANEHELRVKSQPREPAALAAALASGDPEVQCLALDALDAYTVATLEPDVTGLVEAAAPVGWNARRTLRRLGHGTRAQRRALARG